MTSWFAPPWRGPHSAAMPAEMAAKMLTWVEPTRRTVDVEAFCSWSAWRMNSCVSAAAISGSTWYSSAGTANIMCRKFSAYSSEFCG